MKEKMDIKLPSETFTLTIDFEKNSPNPSRVFKSMSAIIDGFQVIDNDLLAPFNLKCSPILLLEDIQVGSLRSVMKNIIEGVDDEAIKEFNWKRIVGGFLLQGKHTFLKWIENRERIEHRNDLELLSKDLHRV